MEKLVEFIQNHPKAVLVIIVIIGVSILMNILKKAARRARYSAERAVNNAIDRAVYKTVGVGLNQAASIGKQLLNSQDGVTVPDIKSVGGNTKYWVSEIQKDYPNFNASSVQGTIESFVKDYIKYIYRNTDDLGEIVSKTLDLESNRLGKQTVGDIKINKTAIYGYTKDNNTATIVYRCSVGFNAGANHKETRYEVDYSYKVDNPSNYTIGAVCPICGGRYNSINDTECPYCGALVIKDAYMSWLVTNIKTV